MIHKFKRGQFVRITGKTRTLTDGYELSKVGTCNEDAPHLVVGRVAPDRYENQPENAEMYHVIFWPADDDEEGHVEIANLDECSLTLIEDMSEWKS